MFVEVAVDPHQAYSLHLRPRLRVADADRALGQRDRPGVVAAEGLDGVVAQHNEEVLAPPPVGYPEEPPKTLKP
jgi:hypothetical protein